MTADPSPDRCICVCQPRRDCPRHGDDGDLVILVRLDKYKRFLGFASREATDAR